MKMKEYILNLVKMKNNLKIHIVDYDACNIKSIKNALTKIGCDAVVTKDPKELLKAKAIIFPGQGSFPNAMQKLCHSGIKQTLLEIINKEIPFLGICLGLQLVFTKSEEGNSQGLDIFKGKVAKIPSSVKVPHIGWNKVNFDNNHPIFNNIPNDSYFYFVHSYYAIPNDKSNIIANTNYGITFCSAFANKNYVGLQFHPERSGEIGLEIYKNFITKIM